MQVTIRKPLRRPLLGFNRPVRTRPSGCFMSAPETTFTRIKITGSQLLTIPQENLQTRQKLEPARALRNVDSSLISNPPNTEKPEWWWRTLAALPYLMNFSDHRSWTYAYPTKNPSPFLKHFESHTFPLVLAISVLPRFILTFYGIFCYFGVIRQERWPHFLRFHVATAVLVGTALQVVGATGGWFPSWVFPPHFWSAASLGFLMTEMYCISCALRGMYPQLPCVSEAAYLYTDLKLR